MTNLETRLNHIQRFLDEAVANATLDNAPDDPELISLAAKSIAASIPFQMLEKFSIMAFYEQDLLIRQLDTKYKTHYSTDADWPTIQSYWDDTEKKKMYELECKEAEIENKMRHYITEKTRGMGIDQNGAVYVRRALQETVPDNELKANILVSRN